MYSHITVYTHCTYSGSLFQPLFRCWRSQYSLGYKHTCIILCMNTNITIPALAHTRTKFKSHPTSPAGHAQEYGTNSFHITTFNVITPSIRRNNGRILQSNVKKTNKRYRHWEHNKSQYLQSQIYLHFHNGQLFRWHESPQNYPWPI